jgi:hypothetical protein
VSPKAGLDTEARGKILLPLPGIKILSPDDPSTWQKQITRQSYWKYKIMNVKHGAQALNGPTCNHNKERQKPVKNEMQYNANRIIYLQMRT